jgi:hypothetical protein
MPKFDFDSFSDLYKIGRTYPNGKPHDGHPKVKAQTIPTPDPKQQAVQDRESRAESLNDVPVKSWLRGYGDTQDQYPTGVDVRRSGTRYGRRSEKD